MREVPYQEVKESEERQAAMKLLHCGQQSDDEEEEEEDAEDQQDDIVHSHTARKKEGMKSLYVVRATFRILLKGGQNSCFRIPGGASATCCTLQYSKISRGGQTSSKGGRMPPPHPPKKTLVVVVKN